LTRPAALRLAPALLAAALVGALQTLAFVHTAAWPLPLLAIALLAGGVLRATPLQAALLGWVFGCAWLGASTWWLFISLHRYGGLPALLAVIAVGLLCALLSLYLAGAMAWVAHRRSGRPLVDASRFAAAWLVAELARGVIFTGFPWAATGYSQIDGPLAPLLPWLGVYALGALLAWVAAALAAGVILALDRSGGGIAAPSRPSQAMRARVPWLLALLVLALPAGWTIWRGAPDFTRPGGTLRVALLQTNVAQDEKFAAEHLPASLDWVAAALIGAQADLVLAPETAVPLLPDQLAELKPGYWAALQQHFSRPGGPVALVGVPLGNYDLGYTNSVLGLSAAATDFRYDKTHLVPFGEFIPTGFRWFTELMNIPLGDFNRGARNPPSFLAHGERVGPNICYEDLFGEELALRFADADQAPSILANVSNIAWFGDTIAVAQHLQISRARSLEFQRPMLRATNTGATAVIDHRGVVTAQLAPFTRGVLTATVQGRQGLTPFARWSAAAGLWPLWALAALGLAWPSAGRSAGTAARRRQTAR
jgi:apolipoprotein N-acyltransferase